MQLAAAERLMHEHEDSESQARTGPKRAAAATAAATASRPSPRASPRVMPRMSPRAMSLASPRSLPSPHTLPPPRSPAVPPGRSPDAAAASAELALSSCSDDPGLRSDDDMTHGRGPDACAARAPPPPRKPIHFRSTEYVVLTEEAEAADGASVPTSGHTRSPQTQTRWRVAGHRVNDVSRRSAAGLSAEEPLDDEEALAISRLMRASNVWCDAVPSMMGDADDSAALLWDNSAKWQA